MRFLNLPRSVGWIRVTQTQQQADVAEPCVTWCLCRAQLWFLLSAEGAGAADGESQGSPPEAALQAEG